MPTVQEIINFADRFYPNSTTTADKVSDLNDLLTDVHMVMRKLTNDYKVYEDTSVAGTAFYSLPANARMEDVIKVMVETAESSGEYEEFSYAGIGEDITTGNYYGRATTGLFFLFTDELALTTTNRKINLYYYPRPAKLSVSSLGSTPELDEDYHDLLKFGLIQLLACQGHSPDTEIANYWQGKYDSKLKLVTDSISDRLNNAPTIRAEAKERM